MNEQNKTSLTHDLEEAIQDAIDRNIADLLGRFNLVCNQYHEDDEIEIETYNCGLAEDCAEPIVSFKAPLYDLLLENLSNHRYMSKRHNKFGFSRSGKDFIDSIRAIADRLEQAVLNSHGWEPTDFPEMEQTND